MAALRQHYEGVFIDLAEEQAESKLKSWILMQAQTEATRICDHAELCKLMDVFCKSQNQSLESWTTYIALVKQCDLKSDDFPKHVRTTYKRGVIQFCKNDKAKLAQKWLSFEEQNGTAESILDCQKAIRKALPQGLSNEASPVIDVVEETKDDMKSVASSTDHRGKDTPKFTLFVKNLSLEAEEEDILALFRQKLPSVKVLSVRLIRDKVDNSKRGIAFVDVATQQMAEDALVLN